VGNVGSLAHCAGMTMTRAGVTHIDMQLNSITCGNQNGILVRSPPEKKHECLSPRRKVSGLFF
jgi:hypothetical protein